MANKTVSIKKATDQELEALYKRLRLENDVQNLIADLKRKSAPSHGFVPYDQPNVSTEEPIENLYHFGIRGMRWGFRKAASSGSGSLSRIKGKKSSTKDDDDETSEDHKVSRVLKKKQVKNLSTAELKKLNERMQLEQTYKTLNPSAYKKGMEIVKSITATGKAASEIYNLVNSPLGQEIMKNFTKTAKAAAKGG